METTSDAKMFEKTVRAHFKTLTATHGVEGNLLIWKPDDNIDKLRKKYWEALAHTHYLDYVIKTREKAYQESCDHNWEYEASRDERTRYTCKKCGFFR